MTTLPLAHEVQAVPPRSPKSKKKLADIVLLNTVAPLLIQANFENAQIPQVSNLLNNADEM